jgi:hypothetical protein
MNRSRHSQAFLIRGGSRQWSVLPVPGLWTKSDSITWFESIEVKSLD